ncbi:hypothetical protein G7K_4446-t1 [Saitoella complicata NRRL Y-17804]|uniref:Uncharacterized protein n=1 Tax=Saitoella complicata (strain BCRC 22490 / CBS 7301 / JCM 7358 / NBRC 10748 / NRRL Y-17804) TaxID=698492 RepID=A0A0E9NKT5_SAICN|nr:hypothetical protein G7K_4446-t1 [Saitoella complicata NRRL Y-17804]
MSPSSRDFIGGGSLPQLYAAENTAMTQERVGRLQIAARPPQERHDHEHFEYLHETAMQTYFSRQAAILRLRMVASHLRQSIKGRSGTGIGFLLLPMGFTYRFFSCGVALPASGVVRGWI